MKDNKWSRLLKYVTGLDKQRQKTGFSALRPLLSDPERSTLAKIVNVLRAQLVLPSVSFSPNEEVEEVYVPRSLFIRRPTAAAPLIDSGAAERSHPQ
jgi:hypothetical protein